MVIENKFGNNDMVTSATGVISLLNEEETSLKIFGLEKLNTIVDMYWPELAEYIFKIEELCEDADFQGRELASLVASKVYFHLERYTEALKYALCAGKLFNMHEKSKYVETMLAKCIEKYVELRELNYEQGAGAVDETNIHYHPRSTILDKEESDVLVEDFTEEIHKKMESLVDEMIEICIRSNNSEQALGVALDARRLDKIAYIISNASNKTEILQHSIQIEKHIHMDKRFRKDFFSVLVSIYSSLSEEELRTEYTNLCECFFYINDSESVAEILLRLLENYHLMAYQIAFDLVDFENRSFLKGILKHIGNKLKQNESFHIVKEERNVENDSKENEAKEEKLKKEETVERDMKKEEETELNAEEKKKEEEKENLDEQDLLLPKETNETAEADTTPTKEKEESKEVDPEIAEIEEILKGIPTSHGMYDKLKKLLLILSGQVTVTLYIEFLHRNNHADLVLLDMYKNVVDSRSSITHHGIIITHALMQTGTTCDVFLRANIEWLSKAMNWAKFSATASLGVVYKGHVKESFNVLSTHLPSGNSRSDQRNQNFLSASGNAGGMQSNNVYSEGGALYALGLIHANCKTNNKQVKSYLLQQLRSSNNGEVIQHGCCLGLGLVCLGSNQEDEEVYDEMKSVLYSDSAVAGESAAYAIGLLKLGSADEKCVDELLAYAHDTQHEKITRACSISLGFVMFQKEREADALIEEMINDKDAIIRYGGMFTIAMAYCGLSNCNKDIIKKLLHFSVSDVSDDVRRAAVIALGFVLCNNSTEVPKFLNLLIESYNPHVRYGAALALGIACSASANEEAIQMLMPLLTDTTDFVRQSAFIALGLIFQQSNEHVSPNFKRYKDEIMKILSDKHEDIIAKFGAIVSAGLLDICGRNAVSSFFTRRGNMIRPQAAVGFCLFSQLWYWFPLIHMISLTFLPTCLIALTDELRMPKNFTVVSNCKNPIFEYPGYVSKEKTQERKEAMTAVLSTTAKRRSLKLKRSKNSNDKKGANVTTTATTTPPTITTSTTGVTNSAGQEKVIEKTTQDDNSSVLSDGKSMKNLEVLSTAATVGQSSHVSHSGSIAGSANEEPANEQNSESNVSSMPAAPKIRKIEVKSCNTVDLKNPCRVIKAQEKFIEYQPNARYKPILPFRKSGFILLMDTMPNEKPEYIETKLDEETKKEAPPFEPFAWKEY